jgi:hypothetical protein
VACRFLARSDKFEPHAEGCSSADVEAVNNGYPTISSAINVPAQPTVENSVTQADGFSGNFRLSP